MLTLSLLMALLSSFSFALPRTFPRNDYEHRFSTQNLTRRASMRGPSSTSAPDGASSVSTNWGGAVINVDIVGFWKVVTGTVVLPHPTLPSGTTTSGATIAIGIDGSTCDTASLQVGIDMTVSASGGVSYDAWFMWLPDTFGPIFFKNAGTNITFSPGDLVTFSLFTYPSTTRTQGVAMVSNGATGALAVENISVDTPLCMEDAEWTVQTLDNTTPLVNFGSLTFTNALALTSSADPGNLPAVDKLILQRVGGPVLTSTSVTESTITVTYVGP